MKSTTLKNNIVFITGASSGIGKACAHAFAAVGAHLILCARRLHLLEALSTEIKQLHAVDIYTLKLDVCDHNAVIEAIAHLPLKWQSIKVLINNAGLAVGLDPLQAGDVNDWEEMINTNIKGLLYVTRALLPRMVEENKGHIINIGSISGHVVYPKGAVYCATKHAVRALSSGMRMDLLDTKIRVSSIDPGATHTEFSTTRFKGDKERAAAVYEGITPLTADDIADAVLYCASRPPHVNIDEILIMPTDQASATLFSRKQPASR